jgi:REP element-mobilizing transposase RayT
MAHQSRLRLGRVSLPGQPYHIISATNSRRPLFADPATARAVVRAMRRMQKDGWLRSHAWVLMSDHLHWLFTLGERAGLSATLNRFKSGSAHAVRGLHPETTQLWQAGFFDHGIRGDEDLRAIARYIIANPLRAGLCEHVGDYPWWDADWL